MNGAGRAAAGSGWRVGRGGASRLLAAAGTPAGVARRRRRGRWRRGVAAVLAMMFMILFGSLSAAMAISSRGNITTAATNLHVSRAHAAAQTGMMVATARLAEAAAQFRVGSSDINASFAWDLWRGQTAGLGTVEVDPSRTGRQDTARPAGLVNALANLHALDQNLLPEVAVAEPTIGARLADVRDAESYRATNWLFTPAVSLESLVGDAEQPPLAYSIVYAPLADRPVVRVIVTGYDFSYAREGRPVTRTITQDFRLNKRVKQAIISPSRVMIGKNVMITGGLGARFTDVGFNHGDPLVIRSDFDGVVPAAKLAALRNALRDFDLDGDNRLRTRADDPEADGVAAASTEVGLTDPETMFRDVTRDGLFDEFDLYILELDTDGDGRVSEAEGAIDPDLFRLIDSSNPDRNRNGVHGFNDANRNNRRDEGEDFLDLDPITGVARDQRLGYLDGFVDWRDEYVKVRGRLQFRVSESAWTGARGALEGKIQGPIRPGAGQSPMEFAVSDRELADVNMSIFSSARTALQDAADGRSFAQQIASPVAVPGTEPSVQLLAPDADGDGLPDNHASAHFERMPFNAPTYSDVYFRPVFRNMVFRDVVIPAGTNALFENCWFIGVTHIRAHTDNSHTLWGEYGKLVLGPSGTPVPARRITLLPATSTDFPTVIPSSARRPDGTLIQHNPPLDRADLRASECALNPAGCNLLPAPLVVDGRRITDTKQLSNNIRFHNSLIVGSIVSDAPSNFTQSRNKVQFTGSTRFAQSNPFSDEDADNPEERDLQQIRSSSMMLPNYSVDIGSFNSPPDQSVDLRGAIIAGVMDIRGNASIDGALLLTFAPTLGGGPLRDAGGNPVGNPANFNTTLGYFGPDDGDAEALDPATLPIDSATGRRIAGWDTDGDGFADVPGTASRPAGATPVLFNGFGAIRVNFDPNMSLPDGIVLPMTFDPIPASYREGHP